MDEDADYFGGGFENDVPGGEGKAKMERKRETDREGLLISVFLLS